MVSYKRSKFLAGLRHGYENILAPILISSELSSLYEIYISVQRISINANSVALNDKSTLALSSKGKFLEVAEKEIFVVVLVVMISFLV